MLEHPPYSPDLTPAISTCLDPRKEALQSVNIENNAAVENYLQTQQISDGI